MVQNTAISAHNNEQMFGLSVEQCEAACCARAWCKSFDYTSSDSTHPSGLRCDLADVDATRQFADTVADPGWQLYERTSPAVLPPILGATGCEEMLLSVSGEHCRFLWLMSQPNTLNCRRRQWHLLWRERRRVQRWRTAQLYGGMCDRLDAVSPRRLVSDLAARSTLHQSLSESVGLGLDAVGFRQVCETVLDVAEGQHGRLEPAHRDRALRARNVRQVCSGCAHLSTAGNFHLEQRDSAGVD